MIDGRRCRNSNSRPTHKKLLINSIIPTPGAERFTMDIKNFYLNTPMARKEYLRLKLCDMTDDIIEECGLCEKAMKDGYVYVAVSKGMYGLPQSRIIAQQLLEERLGKEGYTQSQLIQGLWSRKWRPVQFSPVFDNFGVK